MVKLHCLLIGLFIIISLQAQVTIGVTDAPMDGALLDLKEETKIGANSKKGLLLPRVKLTDPTLLYPMFETTPGSGVANEYYDSDEKRNSENLNHIGLTVYNLSNCDKKFNKGVYSWDGRRWNQLLNIPILGTPNVSINYPNDFIEIPSGLDARIMASPFNFTATAISNSMTLNTKGEYTNYETLFSPMPWTNNGQKTINNSSDGYNLQVNSMDDLTSFPNIKPNATKPVKPWYSRQWELTYMPDPNECGPGTPKTIILNQTNYAIKVGDFVNSITYSFYNRNDFGSAKQGSFPVSSNVKWTTEIRGLEDGNLVSVTPAIGIEHGSNRNDGTKEDLTGDFSFTLNLPQTTPKYHKNEVVFKDANNDIKRAKDIVVTFINCTNEEPTLDEWKIRAGVDALAEGVAHPISTIAWHKDQGGRTFFSADFGSAGRWMINNLAVDKYDPRRSDGSTIDTRDILERRYSTGTAPEVAYDPSYVFPTDQASEIADIDDDVVFQSNQRYGYMYNWTAISKNKGVIFDVKAPDPITGDTGHRYADLPSEIGTDHAKIQGICPYGWHVPSDKEWTILENEIIHNTSLYSSTSDIDPSQEERFDPNNTTTDREMLTHGLPMKDMCQPYGDFLASQPEGTRFKPTQGTSNIMSPTRRAGFNLLLPGVASTKAGGTISFFGWMANYWSSSTINKGQVMGRLMQYTTDVMTRGQVAKSTLLPVRCKKDE